MTTTTLAPPQLINSILSCIAKSHEQVDEINESYCYHLKTILNTLKSIVNRELSSGSLNELHLYDYCNWINSFDEYIQIRSQYRLLKKHTRICKELCDTILPEINRLYGQVESISGREDTTIAIGKLECLQIEYSTAQSTIEEISQESNDMDDIIHHIILHKEESFHKSSIGLLCCQYVKRMEQRYYQPGSHIPDYWVNTFKHALLHIFIPKDRIMERLYDPISLKKSDVSILITIFRVLEEYYSLDFEIILHDRLSQEDKQRLELGKSMLIVSCMLTGLEIGDYLRNRNLRDYIYVEGAILDCLHIKDIESRISHI